MAWGDLAINQMVSYTDAQTSGATLKSGQSHVTSNQCMTRLDIVTKYNVIISEFLFPNNQLVPKGAWGIISGFSATMTVGNTSAYYGYYSNLFGSISNADISAIAGSNAILHGLYYNNSAGNLIFHIVNNSTTVDPSGWTTLSINGSNYNRSSFVFKGYVSFYGYWEWVLVTSNPIGTAIGSTKTITLI